MFLAAAPLTAHGGDYKRKDYLESYERNYERANSRPSGPDAKLEDSSGNTNEDSSFDEYSLYEWTRNRENEIARSGPAPEPEWLRDIKKYNEDMKILREKNAASYQEERIDDLERKLESQNRELERERNEARLKKYFPDDD
jgi:hypothetical protein